MIAARLKETQEQTQVKGEYGLCENDKPCVGFLCNKWDRVAGKVDPETQQPAGQCAVRSMGEAATILMEVFAPQIMAAAEGRVVEADEPEQGDKSNSDLTE